MFLEHDSEVNIDFAHVLMCVHVCGVLYTPAHVLMCVHICGVLYTPDHILTCVYKKLCWIFTVCPSRLTSCLKQNQPSESS